RVPRDAHAGREVVLVAAILEVDERNLPWRAGGREDDRVVDVEPRVEYLRLVVVTQAQVQRQVRRRFPLVLHIGFRVPFGQTAANGRQRLREENRALQAGLRRVRAVEDLIGVERPRAAIRRNVVLAEQALRAAAELPDVAAELRRRNREVIADFLCPLQDVQT